MPTEEQLQEVHRLAILGGEADIAQDMTGRLAGAWLGFSRFQDVKDLCLKTLELEHDASTLNHLAQAKEVLGEVDEARRLYLDAFKMYEEVGDRAGMAVTLNNIGGVYASTGRPERALEYYGKALPLREEVGDRAGMATTLNNIEYYALPLLEEVGRFTPARVSRSGRWSTLVRPFPLKRR